MIRCFRHSKQAGSQGRMIRRSPRAKVLTGCGLDRGRGGHTRVVREPDSDLGRRTHEAGLREGLFGAVRSFIDAHQLLPKGVKLLPEDVFARASFVLSAKVLDPFQGRSRSVC